MRVQYRTSGKSPRSRWEAPSEVTGFAFSQDVVLEAGLMLADIASVGFKVENFTSENMAKLEADWPVTRSALVRTVELASFGLNGQTLLADSALLPIAYYLHRRKAASRAKPPTAPRPTSVVALATTWQSRLAPVPAAPVPLASGTGAAGI